MRGSSIRSRSGAAVTTTFVVACCLAVATTQAASITNVGLFPGGSSAEVDGLDGDGSVAVGYGRTAANALRAFRWTATTGTIQDLGVLPGDLRSSAAAVSGDGSVVVGMSWNNLTSTARAFRWTATSGTMEDLGGLPGATWSDARAMTPDASTVVGESSGTSTMAARWTSGGVEAIGFFAGGSYSYAYGVSHDGSVVVGYGDTATSGARAYRWTAASNTMQDLGTLPGGSETTGAIAWAVNGDGSVVVGANGSGSSSRAFRWTLSSGTMQDLGFLPDGTWARAYAVSADGATVVGEAEDANGDARAFFWTPTLGMRDLNTYLAALGVDLTDWTLETSYAVSADGNTIGGYGTYQGSGAGFVANITLAPVPEPSTIVTAAIGLSAAGALLRRRRRRPNPCYSRP